MTEQISHVQFQEWTKHRAPLVIGTNAGSEPVAFQNWRKFKEAFVPELIARAVAETSESIGRPVQNCLDPCAGSGTTPLACQFLGVHPIAIEVNPYLADLVEAKLTYVDAATVAARCGEVLSSYKKIDPDDFYANAPATFVEPGINGRFLFQRDIAERLATILNAIHDVPEPEIRRLFKVLLGSAAIEVCNAVVSGKGRRYRRNWHLIKRRAADLDMAFVTALEGAVYDIARYADRKTRAFDLVRGDARYEILNIKEELDLAVFSPPYPNSFDYTDVYNIELWALGYLRELTDNRTLREATLRSHVQIKRDFSSANLPLVVQTSMKCLRQVEGLWNKNIPDMVGAYFDDMAKIIGAIRSKMRVGGRVYMVVGDSKYAGIDIPVATALAEMSPNLGYELITAEPFRSMRASPQQGGRKELAETLLVLGAC